MKLHVGCGTRHLPGWVNLDSRPLPNVDKVCDVRKLDVWYKPNSVDEIYHCALLEHLRPEEVVEVLDIFHRILKPGGKLWSSVPDFTEIVASYRDGEVQLSHLFGLLFGRGDYPENVHRCAFDFLYLDGLLRGAGFANVRRYDWRDFLPDGYDDFSRAYIPHMDFENGTAMMLNIVAEKR